MLSAFLFPLFKNSTLSFSVLFLIFLIETKATAFNFYFNFALSSALACYHSETQFLYKNSLLGSLASFRIHENNHTDGPKALARRNIGTAHYGTGSISNFRSNICNLLPG